MGFSIRGAVVLACVLSFVARAWAEPAELPLAEIIKVAVRQSPELERARIDVEAARAALLQAEGIEDVHVGATVKSEILRPPPADNTTNELNDWSVALSASRALPTGGSVSVNGVVLWNRDNVVEQALPPPGAADPDAVILQRVPSRQAVTQLGATVKQPLLRGAGPSVFEAPIRAAAQRRDAAALLREARARDLVVSLAQAYWQVSFAWRQLEVRKGSLELAEKQLEHTLGAIRAEKVARSEALAVQQAIAIRKQDVIAGEQELYERSLALRQLGGLEIGPDAIAVQTERLPSAIETVPLDVAAIVRAAFEHSAELASLEASRNAAETGVVAADGAARSALDLEISGTVVGAGRIASQAISSTVDEHGFQVNASLTFDHALQHRTERGGQAAARATLLTAKTTEREARARLAVRATRAAQRAQAALANVALGDEAINLAEQNIVAEQRRFELGKTTNFEVLRRQEELEQARLRHASAIADYLSVRADLDGLTGAILARYSIVMQ